jgi:hypothetical protein
MNTALSIGSATIRHIGGTLNRRDETEARAMKRAILFTAITALILGISGLRPAEAAGALNHGPRLTVKVAKPGLVQKAHHRRFSRGRGHRFSRGRGYHRHYYRLFSGAVVTRWHWHRWPGYGGRQFSQRRHHR